jgi:pimeloyl-ACP methyl ester carboxylesterase
VAVFVLVHPAWFGGWCWSKLARQLRAHGHQVHTPTLTGLGERAHLAGPGVGLATHVEDVASLLHFEDLDGVVLVGTSSAGAVVTAVADRVPERIRQVVYLDAFVPADGQSLVDMIPPDRRPAMEALVEREGGGWLLPRFGAAPWEEFVPKAWQVTEPEDLRWVLDRLRPTPLGHFTEPVRLHHADDEQPHRAYIRCLRWPNPSFDRYAANAQSSLAWGYRELATSHLPYITHPDELRTVLLELTD